MKKFLLLFIFLLLPVLAWPQQAIQSYDTELDSTYYTFYKTWNSPDSLTYAHTSLETSTVFAGDGAFRIEWSVENTVSWGGYSRLMHTLPAQGGLYDWSSYDSLSFWYYNEQPEDSVGRGHLRLVLLDASDVSDTLTASADLENWFSFHYILDEVPGWNEVKIPLVDGRNDPELDEWAGEAFNRTGWNGPAGNDELDLNAIKGFYFEFIIAAVEPYDDVNTGIMIMDEMSLKGFTGVELVLFNGKNFPTSHSPFTWGWSGLEVVEDAGATPGTNAFKWTQGDQWSNGATGAGFNLPVYNLSMNWMTDSLKFKLKTESTVDSIRLRFEDGANKVKYEFDPIDDGTWHDYSFALQDFVLHDSDGFDTTNVKVFQMTSIDNAVAGNVLYFDDMWTGSPEIDVVGPIAPDGIAGIPNTTEHYNLVIWNDIPEEDKESYTVYGSDQPITSIEDAGVFMITAEVPAGTGSTVHYLTYPLKEKELTFYYAVMATDFSGNIGALGASASGTVNNALAVPTISLDPPQDFVADGDITEWINSSIMPFDLAPSVNHVQGTFDNDDDLQVTGYLAFDDDFMYIAFDAIDNIYSYDPAGNFWEDDIAEIYIGLYNQTYEHTGFQRGEEPDYKLIAESDKFFNSSASSSTPLYVLSDANYAFVDYGTSDWSFEVKIPLDSMNTGNASEDARFHPENGMRIPLDLNFHDSDVANVRDGILSFSEENSAYIGAQQWSYTWIGDTTVTGINDEPGNTGVRHFELSQNYPNPFNPVTNISYQIASTGKVNLSVYNVLGQQVQTLVNNTQNAGRYTIAFDAAKYATGVYFYKLESGSSIQIKKMLLVK